MSCIASQVTLNGIQFDVDPTEYTPLGGVRRGSVHRLIDGTTTYQDFGLNPSDMIVTLTGDTVTLATAQALWALYVAAPAGPYIFADWAGNNLNVIFTPGKESFRFSQIRGANDCYRYIMELSVVSVNSVLTT